MTLRSIFIIVGVVVVFLLLFTSNTLSGQICVRDSGCVIGDGDGVRFQKAQAAPTLFQPPSSSSSSSSK